MSPYRSPSPPPSCERPENGPMQFGDDWPGLFLRGDEAGPMGMLLQQYLDTDESSRADDVTFLPLHSLAESLSSAVQRDHMDALQKLRPWAECQPGNLRATRFEGPEFHVPRTQAPSKLIVESRGDDKWAIIWAWTREVWTRDGKFEYEPSPSNRDDAFLARARFDWSEVEDQIARATKFLMEGGLER